MLTLYKVFWISDYLQKHQHWSWGDETCIVKILFFCDFPFIHCIIFCTLGNPWFSVFHWPINPLFVASPPDQMQHFLQNSKLHCRLNKPILDLTSITLTVQNIMQVFVSSHSTNHYKSCKFVLSDIECWNANGTYLIHNKKLSRGRTNTTTIVGFYICCSLCKQTQAAVSGLVIE